MAALRGMFKILVVIGPPGSGKTRWCESVFATLLKNKTPFVFLAPTAKAAGIPTLDPGDPDRTGLTVDRFVLKMKPRVRSQGRPAMTEVAARADLEPFVKRAQHRVVVFVDEVSMLTTSHFGHLLEALAWFRHAVIVLLGDMNQLGPVNGQPFFVHPQFDRWLEADKVAATVLKANHRSGQCKALQYVIDTVASQKPTAELKDILWGLSRKTSGPRPEYFLAHRRETCNEENLRVASTLVDDLGPDNYSMFMTAGGEKRIPIGPGFLIESTRNVWSREQRRYTWCNHDKGVVVALIALPDKKRDNAPTFNGMHTPAFVVQLLGTNETIDVYPRRIKGRKEPVVDVAHAWASTIHCAQGDTYKTGRVVVDWRHLSWRLMLVAFSRAASIAQLYIKNFNPDDVADRFRTSERDAHIIEQEQKFISKIQALDQISAPSSTDTPPLGVKRKASGSFKHIVQKPCRKEL